MATSSSCIWGLCANADKKYFKNQIAFWWNELMGTALRRILEARNLLPHLKDIKPAVMTVGGWFDAEDLFGALDTYQAASSTNSPASRITWSWGRGRTAAGRAATAITLGDVSFARKDREFYRDKIEFPFFQYYLKGKGELQSARGLRFRDGHQPVASA